MEEATQFETLITGLIQRNYGLCDGFLTDEILVGLRKNITSYYQSGQMHPAGIGRHFDFQKNLEVRGDVIRWIEEDTKDIFENILLEKISHLISYLNETCFTRINDMEFHYARYDVGSFYKRHLDQFKSHRGRKYSLVIYLNEEWKEEDGGNLRLYLENDRVEDVYPLGGRAVFFKSDELEHEVMPAPKRSRLSIAGWLKSV